MNPSAEPTAAIGQWLAQPSIDWSPQARELASLCILDVAGCALAGAGDPAAVMARKPLTGSVGMATVIGTPLRWPAPWAALANGVAAHALDFDDNYAPGMAHASAVLLPALLAVGESRQSVGRELVDAFLCGLEVMAAVGFAVNPAHRQRGWHATATVGAVGAAAAVARLLRLDATSASAALSLATSQAAGSMRQFGYMAKPLHAGLAAQAGVMSALWAESGMTANPEPFVGTHGIQQLWVGPDLDALREEGTGYEAEGFDLRLAPPPAQGPYALERLPPVLKLWPNCASTHPSVQALLELRGQCFSGKGEVDRIDIHTRATYLANLMYPVPADPMQARFSLEYAAALAWGQGTVTLDDFDPDALHRPHLRALMTRIHRHALSSGSPASLEVRVEIRLRDGPAVWCELHEHQIIGDRDRPLKRARLTEKFRATAGRALASDRVAHLIGLFEAIDSELPIQVLGAAMASRRQEAR